MSLLTIVQDACDRLSLPRPTAVVSSTDQTVRQFLALAKVEAEDLARTPEHGWQAMVREHTFSTVAAQEQVGAVPADLDYCIPDAAYNRTTNRKLVGPLDAHQWQAQMAYSTLAAQDVFRIRGGVFLFLDPPPAGQIIAYEYSSAWYARSSAGQRKAAFTADEDETFLPEALITHGLVWRWKQAKGLDYGEDMITYGRAVSRAIARDGGMKALSGRRMYDMREVNVPEGDFPGA